jgi:hypothetical protein
LRRTVGRAFVLSPHPSADLLSQAREFSARTESLPRSEIARVERIAIELETLDRGNPETLAVIRKPLAPLLGQPIGQTDMLLLVDLASSSQVETLREIPQPIGRSAKTTEQRGEALSRSSRYVKLQRTCPHSGRADRESDEADRGCLAA